MDEKEIKYDITKPWLSLDPWQKEYIETDGNCALLCGRQVGKSTAMAIKAGELAIKNKDFPIMIIAFTENQAYELFFKTLLYIESRYGWMIKKGKDKPTQHEINLTNGSTIECRAAGLTGEGVRGKTIKKLFVDEARNMAREVFVAVLPMLSVIGGSIDIASTPCGKQGFFWDCFNPQKDMGFNKFYVSAENCPRHKKEFLESEKKRLSEKEYSQEYLAAFLDELSRYFPDELLKSMKEKGKFQKAPETITQDYPLYLGVDIARLGHDEGTFEIIQRISKDDLRHVKNIVTKKKLTTETERTILELHEKYSFREIDLDAGAGTLGVSIFDHLLDNEKTKRVVVAINNRDRPFTRDESRRGKILKEDLYDNLRALMEQGKITLLEDDDLILSLKSVQYEYMIKEGQETKMRIYGDYTHIVEGLIRAAWAAAKDKKQDPWIR